MELKSSNSPNLTLLRSCVTVLLLCYLCVTRILFEYTYTSIHSLMLLRRLYSCGVLFVCHDRTKNRLRAGGQWCAQQAIFT